MSEQSFPVTIRVKRPDGSLESVRVGTAVREGDGFRLSLGELSIEGQPDSVSAAPTRRPAPTGDVRASMAVFPPYGRSKGAPIAGASIEDLEFYIRGSRRTLDDPAKSRWHDKERALLAVMEAELARQQGGEGGGDFGGHDEFDGVPPPSDEDIPF